LPGDLIWVEHVMTGTNNGNAYVAPSILIILMGSLGDVARGLCLVSQIKEGLPKSTVTWLVEPKCKALVEIHPKIDKVVVFDRPKGTFAIPKLYRHLARERFDITLDLQRHFKSGMFSFLSGARRRIGFHRRDAKELNWVFNNEHIPYFGDDLPKWRHYLKFTEYLGLETPKRLNFGLSGLNLVPYLPEAVSHMTGLFVVVVMGSAWQSKDWLYERYLTLVTDLVTSGKIQVVLVGEESQRIKSTRLCEQLHGRRPINLVGETSMMELVAVIRVANAAVGPDSGPGHLAAAVGTPYISLFGPTSARRTAPYGNEHLVVEAGAACSPCYKRVCPESERTCMQRIEADTVKKKLSEAILGQGEQGFFN